MPTAPARCLYALRPHDRPGCQLTATVAYGPTMLCSSCNQQRSTVGKGHVTRALPDTTPDPLGLLADVHHQLDDAGKRLNAAV